MGENGYGPWRFAPEGIMGERTFGGGSPQFPLVKNNTDDILVAQLQSRVEGIQMSVVRFGSSQSFSYLI